MQNLQARTNNSGHLLSLYNNKGRNGVIANSIFRDIPPDRGLQEVVPVQRTHMQSSFQNSGPSWRMLEPENVFADKLLNLLGSFRKYKNCSKNPQSCIVEDHTESSMCVSCKMLPMCWTGHGSNNLGVINPNVEISCIVGRVR